MGFLDRLFGRKKKQEEPNALKIGIILGSVREGRNGEQVAQWIYDYATKRHDEGAEYELVDLAEYKLPLLGSDVPEADQEKANAAVKAWSEKMASFDGYVIVAPEYNHAIGGALKNALDYLNEEVNNKAAGFVGYGSLGGTRAHENLRLILGELQVADVRTALTFSLMADFENYSVFKPAEYHENNANQMLDELIRWSSAFKTLRKAA